MQFGELPQLGYPRRLGNRMARAAPRWLEPQWPPGPEHPAGPEHLAGWALGHRRRREPGAGPWGVPRVPARTGRPARHELGLAEAYQRETRPLRPDIGTQVPQLCRAELKTPAADGTHEVVVSAIGHDGHEVEAHRFLRSNVVEEHLVMAVGAHRWHDLAQVLPFPRPEAENHHHAPIGAPARSRRFTRQRVNQASLARVRRLRRAPPSRGPGSTSMSAADIGWPHSEQCSSAWPV